MNSRFYYFSHSIIALLIGFTDYILFRKGTYLHNWFNITESDTFYDLSFFGDVFLKYYLPDFLWAYALTMALFAVVLPKSKKHYIFIIFVSLFGITWEILQKLSFVSGTFDIIDCFMYIIAAIIADLIYLKRG